MQRKLVFKHGKNEHTKHQQRQILITQLFLIISLGPKQRSAICSLYVILISELCSAQSKHGITLLFIITMHCVKLNTIVLTHTCFELSRCFTYNATNFSSSFTITTNISSCLSHQLILVIKTG